MKNPCYVAICWIFCRKCPRCDGSGWVFRSADKPVACHCPNCRARGLVRRRFWLWVTGRQICPVCYGHGHPIYADPRDVPWPGELCKHCDGDGWVWRS